MYFEALISSWFVSIATLNLGGTLLTDNSSLKCDISREKGSLTQKIIFALGLISAIRAAVPSYREVIQYDVDASHRHL